MARNKGPQGPTTADTKRMKAAKKKDDADFEKEHPGLLGRLGKKDGHK